METKNESGIFTSFCSDLLVSANDVDTLFMYSAIAITAWNNAGKTEEDIVKAIEALEKRLKSTSVQNGEKSVSINNLIREMIKRKKTDFNQHEFRILKANFEDQDNKIKVNVETD